MSSPLRWSQLRQAAFQILPGEPPGEGLRRMIVEIGKGTHALLDGREVRKVIGSQHFSSEKTG